MDHIILLLTFDAYVIQSHLPSDADLMMWCFSRLSWPDLCLSDIIVSEVSTLIWLLLLERMTTDQQHLRLIAPKWHQFPRMGHLSWIMNWYYDHWALTKCLSSKEVYFTNFWNPLRLWPLSIWPSLEWPSRSWGHYSDDQWRWRLELYISSRSCYYMTCSIQDRPDSLWQEMNIWR